MTLHLDQPGRVDLLLKYSLFSFYHIFFISFSIRMSRKTIHTYFNLGTHFQRRFDAIVGNLFHFFFFFLTSDSCHFVPCCFASRLNDKTFNLSQVVLFLFFFLCFHFFHPLGIECLGIKPINSLYETNLSILWEWPFFPSGFFCLFLPLIVECENSLKH